MNTKLKKTIKNYLPVFIILVCMVTLVIVAVVNHWTFESVYNYIINNKAQAVVIILFLYALKSVTVIIYYSFLVAVTGFIFRLPQALLINSAGTVICLTISYIMGYNTKSDGFALKIDKHPKIKKYFDKCETNSFLVSYILHALGLSTEVLGIMFGFLKMPYLKYLISSFIAVAPGMVCVTIFGKELDVTSPAFWIAVAVEVTVIVSAYIYSKKRLLKK